MRQFRYPTAIPPSDVRPVDDNGNWTYPWRAYFESLQLQAGGQGGDALYDADIRAAVQAEENRAVIESQGRELRALADRLTAASGDAEQQIQGAIEQVTRLRSELQAQIGAFEASIGDLARLDQAGARNIARSTVGLRQVVSDTGHFLVPAGTYANGAAAQAAFDPLSIQAAPNLRLEADDLVDIEVDVYIEATSKIFNHCYLAVQVDRNGGAGTSVLASRGIYIEHLNNSANMTSTGYEVPHQVTLRLRDTIPSTASDYAYRLLVTNNTVSGSTFEGWNDNSGARELIIKEARIFATKFDPRLLS